MRAPAALIALLALSIPACASEPASTGSGATATQAVPPDVIELSASDAADRMRAGTLTASVVGRRGLGTIAVGVGAEATSFTMIGEGGLAVVASAHVAWRRSDGTWVEETRLPADLDEPTIRTILEAEKPTGTKRSRRVVDDAHRRMRLRIAAVADAIRLSAQTGQRESVEEMLRGFGIDPFDLVALS